MNTRHAQKISIYLFLTLVVMGAIFLFSSQDGYNSQAISDGLLERIKEIIELLPPLTDDGAGKDVRKYAHMFEYALLGITSVLLFTELLWRRTQPSACAAVMSYIFCFAYAALDEFHQYFVPGRSAEFVDTLVDSVGFTAGIMFTLAVGIIVRHIINRNAK